MNYVYIDLGAYDGDTIKSFMKKRKLPVEPSEFLIYAFEPNPNLFYKLIQLFDEYPNIMQINTAAAWIDDKILPFAIDNTKIPLGSSLMTSKRNYNDFRIIEVQCINFSNWIKRFEKDYVIVKMDIEGAEFPILNKMMDNNTHKIIDQLWLETHPHKVIEYTTEDSNKLLARLRRDIYVEEWS